ncbi:MAG: radical SAM protein [Deltaproteobacteria bacterium]|nr:radical SAM protein [Deltaproteobacteria bacterium]
MTLLRVRRGRSPNCSAVGSVVGIAIVSAMVGAAVVNAWAERFLRWTGEGTPPEGSGSPGPGSDPSTPRLRPEAFGAIVAWPEPAALLYVDHEGAADALAAGARPIGGQPSPDGALSAPTEVHLAVSERCPVACTGCYLDAGPEREPTDPSYASLRAALHEAAAMGVFEVAFGGGEAVLRDDLLDLAAEARALGLTPNLTTSGFGVTPERAARMAILFGQVNVSLDGLPGTYEKVRGWDGAAIGLKALDLLRDAGLRTGVNTVLSRQNWDHLPALSAELAARGVSEWQWVRFKPTGRGADAYAELALTPGQAEQILPVALELEASTGLTLRTDCALVPFLAAHEPPPDLLERLGVTGCVGGESLWTRKADGAWRPCSFAEDPEMSSRDEGAMADLWQDSPTLQDWRDYAEHAPEPCASCTYRSVCRGGCRVVARHVTGAPFSPDPECPRVRAS